MKAQKGMQMMGLAAYRLEPFMQLAAVNVPGQHGGAIALSDAPENSIEQAPAILDAKACGVLQQFQQLLGDTQWRCRCWWAAGCWSVVEQPAIVAVSQPSDLMRWQALLQQASGDLTPAGKAAIELHAVHYHSAICAGVSLSCWRSSRDSRLACRGR